MTNTLIGTPDRPNWRPWTWEDYVRMQMTLRKRLISDMYAAMSLRGRK